MIVDMPIVGYYDIQRFKQFNPSDCANWYIVNDQIGKKQAAMYPCLGRKHVTFQGSNRLIFTNSSRLLTKSINYWYNVVDDKIFRIDQFFNEVEITNGIFNTIEGDVFFSYLVAGDITFSIFVAGHQIFVYREDTGTFQLVTDSSAPQKPKFIATFGNRITVSNDGSSQFFLSVLDLGGSSFDPDNCFNFSTPPAHSSLFASESGVIQQMGVLQNTLYIFTDYTVGVWNNIPSTFTSAGGTPSQFPWKKNTTYNWDYGIAFPNTLAIGFGIMTWVSKSYDGLINILSVQNGQLPTPITDSGTNVLLQRLENLAKVNPLQPLSNVDGFIYSYENTIHYRVSVGSYTDTQLVDQILPGNSFEFNFDSQKWSRVIEKNGERNRIQKHVFFSSRHLVSVLGNSTVYEMSGEFYTNDIENPNQPNLQAPDAYIAEPMRYERVTSIIIAGLYPQLKAPGFYSELETKYVEIDFVWGEQTFINSDVPFENAVFVADEALDSKNNPIYIVDENDSNKFLISEQGNLPSINSPNYNSWFKPHIELLYSNDGGISFQSADVLEIAQIGVLQWRMRWYQLGCHRNRVYKLICVSPSPIVILGGVMEVSNVSGGAS